ncbi:PE-PPE domain-containing protein [Mycobacteroides abscessus]|uniref:PE-PPE domain-containing protein n=1 Tax=Mycobacteroides abscessus TaxID=36809 RepID=UPI0021053BA7|nr:PE-PPE domain-containing protein [Mycobacteroides abscessus]
MATALIAAGVSYIAPTAMASDVPRRISTQVELRGLTFGVGPSFDGLGLTNPLFFYGTNVPKGDTFQSVPYPATININYPIISDLPVLSDLPYWPQSQVKSVQKGSNFLLSAIARAPAGENVNIIGMSQGSQVLETVRAEMAQDPRYTSQARTYEFTMLGNPYLPVGGMLTRLSFLKDVPVLNDLISFGRPSPVDSPFKTTNIANQYDGFADFPAYANPLSIVNSLAGIATEHVFPGYVLDNRDNPNKASTTVGNTTYVTIPQLLPILYPIHVATSLVGAQRLVDALDPVLRVFVEMGYDRTADPSKVQQLKLFTPPEKIMASLAELPTAFAQSIKILEGEPYNPTIPAPIVSEQSPAVQPTSSVAGATVPLTTQPREALLSGVLGLESLPVIGPIIKALSTHLPVELGNLVATLSRNPNTIIGRVLTALAGTANNSPQAAHSAVAASNASASFENAVSVASTRIGAVKEATPTAMAAATTELKAVNDEPESRPTKQSKATIEPKVVGAKDQSLATRPKLVVEPKAADAVIDAKSVGNATNEPKVVGAKDVTSSHESGSADQSKVGETRDPQHSPRLALTSPKASTAASQPSSASAPNEKAEAPVKHTRNGEPTGGSAKRNGLQSADSPDAKQHQPSTANEVKQQPAAHDVKPSNEPKTQSTQGTKSESKQGAKSNSKAPNKSAA